MSFLASLALGVTMLVNSVLNVPVQLLNTFSTKQHEAPAVIIDEVHQSDEATPKDQSEELKSAAVPFEADVQTYTVLYQKEDGFYAKDKDRVFYSSRLLGWVPREIFGADPQTFEILYTDDGFLTQYGRDKSKLFLRTFEVKDPATSKEESKAEAQSDSQERAQESGTAATEKKNVSLPSNEVAVFGPTHKPAQLGEPHNVNGSFTLIHEDKKGAYGKDLSRVYHISERTGWEWSEVTGADPFTFSIILTPQNLITFYAKDKKFVYTGRHQLDNADPNTFYVFSGSHEIEGYEYYAKDKNDVYSDGYPVDNADPSSFEPLTYLNNGVSTYTLFAKDSDGFFCGNGELWTDPATFKVLDYNSAIDASHAFEFCNLRTERFPQTITFDTLVKEKQSLGVGIGMKFDPDTQDTSANAVATELTHVLDYMKKGADLFYSQYKTYKGYCENTAMESGMGTLLKRFEGWIGVGSISCLSDAQGFMGAVEIPVAGLYCVDTKGYADVIRDFSLYGHTQSSCPAWQTPQLSKDDEDKMTVINLLSLQKEMYEYYQSKDSYKGACDSTTIAARIKEMPAYGTWGTYCFADEDRFLAETRLSDHNFACVDSEGNAHKIYGTSQYEHQCDLKGTTDYLKRVQAGEIQACVNGECVPIQDYEYDGIYSDTWDEI